MKNKFEEAEKIERIQIPDDDAHNWIKTLEGAGFTLDEIDKIMTHLNKTWRLPKKAEIVRRKMENIVDDFVREGVVLSQEEKRALLRQLEEDFDNE